MNNYAHYYRRIVPLLEMRLKLLGDFKNHLKFGTALMKILQICFILTCISYDDSTVKVGPIKQKQRFF